MLSSAVIILSTVIYSGILHNFHFESLVVAANFVEKMSLIMTKDKWMTMPAAKIKE